MIKQGQIFKTRDGHLFVVGRINDDKTVFYAIFYDGSSRRVETDDTIDYCNQSELIAEYPTWQEAVNSPEFRGEK